MVGKECTNQIVWSRQQNREFCGVKQMWNDEYNLFQPSQNQLLKSYDQADNNTLKLFETRN